MSLIDDIKIKYKTLNVFEQLIAINVVVFLFLRLIGFLMQIDIVSYLMLPEDLGTLALRPWTIFTHMFIHGSFMHLFFNMLVLYFSSRVFLNYLPARTGLNVYFIGGLLGGLFYIVSYNIFPVFAGTQGFALGASAAVMALVTFIGTYFPNQEVRLLFFNLKLWQIAITFVVIDLLQIPVSNSGGHIAHLGGALLGYLYANQLKNGNDIGKWLEQLIAAIGSLFKKSKQPKMKTVHKTRTQKKAEHKTVYQKKRIEQEQIDAILDKISKSGYESLSKAEKEFLFKAGKND